MPEGATALDTYEEHALASLGHAVMGSEVDLIADCVTGKTEISQHLIKERPAAGHEQALHVFGHEHLRLAAFDSGDHVPVEHCAPTSVKPSQAVDGNVLAGKATDDDIRRPRKRRAGRGNVATVQVGCSDVQRVGATCPLVDLVGPREAKRQTGVMAAPERESAQEAQVHTSTPTEEGYDAVFASRPRRMLGGRLPRSRSSAATWCCAGQFDHVS